MRTLLLVFAAVSFHQAARADERTPASAFAFIKNILTDGSWFAEAESCSQSGVYCSTYSDYRIAGVTVVGQSYCKLNFDLFANGARDSATIDLRRNFTVTVEPTAVVFAGPVLNAKGKILARWAIYGPSEEFVGRVGKAIKFIHESCKVESPW